MSSRPTEGKTRANVKPESDDNRRPKKGPPPFKRPSIMDITLRDIDILMSDVREDPSNDTKKRMLLQAMTEYIRAERTRMEFNNE